MKISTLAVTAAAPALGAVVPPSVDTTEAVPASVDVSVDTAEGICTILWKSPPSTEYCPESSAPAVS